MKRLFSVLMAICLLFGTIQPVMATEQSAAQGSGTTTLVCLPDYGYQANVNWTAKEDGMITAVIATYEDEQCEVLSDVIWKSFNVKQGENRVTTQIKDADSVMAKALLLEGDGESLTPLTAAAEIIYDETKVLKDILSTETVDTITTSIQTRNEEYHPARAMIDDDFDGDQMYKSENTSGYDNVNGKAVDLVITMTLKNKYAIDSLKIYENYLSEYGTCTDDVTIQIGTGSSLETAISGASLNTGANGCLATGFLFDKTYTGDKIVITLKGGKAARGNSQSHYQIWEIEAFGEKVAERKDFLTSAATSITTSIQTRNEEYHPASAMLDDDFDGDQMYKSENTSGYDNADGKTVDLVITIDLDDYYAIDTFKIYENYLSEYGVCTDDVTIQIGTGTELATAITGASLSTGASGCRETAFVFDKAYTGNKIVITLKGGKAARGNGQSQYQIFELEAFGEPGEAPVEREDILTGAVESITTSIQTRNEEYHPASAMIDDDFDGDQMYKSENTSGYDNVNGKTVDLVITIDLDDYYEIDTFKIYENYLPEYGVCTDDVTIQIGTGTELATAISGASLSTGASGCRETAFVFDKAYTGNKIVITLKGGKAARGNGQSQYQIFELEAFGEIAENVVVPEDILPAGVKSIATSIMTRNEEYHPATALIDDDFDGDQMYKSENTAGYDNVDGKSVDLVITIDLDAFYEIDTFKIYENYLSAYGTCTDDVTIQIGTGTELATAITGAALNTGADGSVVKTEFIFDKAYIGNKIVVTLKGGKTARGNGQSQYQIYELEAFGVKSDIVIVKGILSTETVESITTSIQSRNEEYHPATAMIDGEMTGDALFKSESANGYDNTEDTPGVSKPMTITIKLKKTYQIDSLKVYENYLSSFQTNVISSVRFGISGDMTTVAQNVTLNTGDDGTAVETTIDFSEIAIGDTIEINFAGGLPQRGDGAESQYQIWELEAFGEEAEQILPLDMDFEDYEGTFSGYPVVTYNSGKALEVAAGSQEQTVKIDALIPGDFVISFDIAVEGTVEGELTVEGGGNPAFVLSFNEDKSIRTYQSSENITNYASNYKNINLVYDSQEYVFDIYADGNKIIEGYDPGGASFDKCVTFTFKFKGTSGNDKVYLDNLLAYPTYMKTDKCSIYDPTAQKPAWDKEIVLTNESYMETNSTPAVLDDCVSVHMRSGVMYANGEKSMLDSLPYSQGDEIMVPAQVLTDGLNLSVQRSGDTVSVGDKVSMTVGANTMQIAQQEYSISAGPAEKDGILYLPLRAIAETGFSKSVSVEQTAVHSGMVIISDDNLEISEGLIHEFSFDATLRNDEHAYFYLSNEKSRTNLGVHFAAKKIVHADDSIATVYKTNWLSTTWTNIKFVYDTQTDIVDVYVGGSKVDSYTAGLNKEFYGIFMQTSDGANAYIDNVNYTVKRKYGTDSSSTGEAIAIYSCSDFSADVFSATEEKQLDNMFYHVKGESKGSTSPGNPGSSFKLGTEGYLTLKNALSNKDANLSGDELQLANDFSFYFRPTKEQWLEDYNASQLKGVHPRVMATADDFARLRQEIQTNSIKRQWYNSLIYQCDNEFMLAPTVKYELRDGVRLLYAADDFTRYMTCLAMAYQLTGDEKYFEAAWKHIEAVATMPDWNPIHHIDVGTMATGYAIAYDWFYDVMTPEQRQIMERGIYNNLFWIVNEAYKDPNTIYGDVRMEDNHNVFCNAGIMASCVAFMDIYPDISSHIAANTLQSLEYFMDKFAPHGAYFEGIDYATIAVDFTARLFAAMEPTMGTLYGVDKAEGYNLSADYIANMQSDVSSFNFADGDPGIAKAPGVFWVYDHYNITGKKDIIARNTLNEPYGEDAVFSLLWYNVKEEEEGAAAALDVYYPGEEIITMRNSNDPGQIFAAIKAGDTVYTHSHLDAGSFVFDANGKRWAHDLGKDDYNLEYKYGFYDIFRRRPESHNTLLINPDDSEGYVLGSRADVISYESQDNGVIAKINMTDLYGSERKVSDAKRGYFFTDDRQSLVVRDEVTFTAASEAYWLMYIDSNASISGNTVILTDKNNSNKKLKIEFLSNYDGEIVVEDAVPFPDSPQIPEQNQNEGYSRLYFKVSAPSGKMEITAKLTPLDMGITESNIENYHIDMNNWAIAGSN